MNSQDKYPNFRLHLFLSIAILMIFPILIIYFYLQDTKRFVRATIEIAEHPYTVSNSVRDIDIYINAMHRSMKDVVLARDETSLEEAVEEVDKYEEQVYTKFDLIFERFLGNPADIQHVYDSFVAWKPIREKVIKSVKAGHYNEAASITQQEGALHVSALIKSTEIMINFADQKAHEYSVQALSVQKTAHKRSKIIIVVLLLTGSAMIYWLINSITKPMTAIINRLRALLKNKLENLSVSQENTFRILDMAISELENSERRARESLIAKTKELQEARNLLEISIDTASIPMVMVFTDGKFKDINEAFCQLIGYSKEELKNMEFNDITYPEDKHIGSEFVQKMLNNEIDRSEFQKRYIKKTGEIILCTLSSSLITNHQSSLQYFFTQIQDITEQTRNALALKNSRNELEEQISARTGELKEKAEKLEKSQKALTYLLEDVNEVGSQLQLSNKMLLQANQELESFSYSVSHDLRAPLRGIHGFTQILMEDYASKLDEEGKRVCTVIKDNSHKMGQLIDDLLAFSRLSRSDLHKSAIAMKEMVNSMFYEITSEESRKKIILEIGDLCEAHGDPAMLKQVWINLLSNAIKFSSIREKAIISVTCKNEKKRYVYCISDNGAGFDMKYVNKLFGVFQRLHSPKEFEGTGVGLANVQRIVIRHGGEVWAEGEVDNGASFYFSLPKIETDLNKD